MKKIILFLLALLFLFPLAFAEDSDTQKVKCLTLGQEGSVGGVPMGKWKLDPPCCDGLKDRETIQVCDSGYAGGYSYVCLQCGDKICDSKFENNCNCPEDCPN